MIVTFVETLVTLCRPLNISEFTQQDGRKRRTAKRLCVTNVTGLLLACSVVIFTKYQCFLVFYKKICLKEVEVCVKFFSNKIIFTLIVTQGLPSSSPVLMRKFTIDSSTVMIRFSPLLPLSAPFLISAPIPLGTPIPISAPILLQVKNKVFAIFPMRDIRKNVLFQFIKLFRLCGDTMLVFFWGAQIWPPQTKRKICFLGFPTNTWVHR